MVLNMAVRRYIKKKYRGIPALNRYKILDAIRDTDTVRNKALISFLYLTACRIEEVVKFIIDGEIIGEPITKKQIEIRDNLIIIRDVRALKSRVKNKVRNIPIIKNRLESEFIDIFLLYYNALENKDSYLFNITRQRAYQILERVNLFPHFLRHSRLTHLVTDYDFSESQLRHFTGWDTSGTATHYTHLRLSDLISKMQKESEF